MGTKTVYNMKNGVEVLAHEDQVTAGLFHLPAGATEVKPPSFDASKKTCSFDGTDWVVKDIPKSDPDPDPADSEPDPPTPTYADKRKLEYPQMQDYLDGIVKDDQTQIDKYISDCKAVKAKYPKS